MRDTPKDHGKSVAQHRFFSYLFTQKRQTASTGNQRTSTENTLKIPKNKNNKRTLITDLSCSTVVTPITVVPYVSCSTLDSSSNDLIQANNEQSQGFCQNKFEENQLIQATEQRQSSMVLLRRSKHVQTDCLQIQRELENGSVLFEDDTCVKILDNEIMPIPLKNFKRIVRLKQFQNEGKIEVEIESDVPYQVQLCEQEKLLDQINDRINFIETTKQNLRDVTYASHHIIRNLFEQSTLKKEQLLNKIDFKRKYVFALEYSMPSTGQISKFQNVLYSQSLLQLLGLDRSISIESYLLKNGLVDLHSLVERKSECFDQENAMTSQYLRPVSNREEEVQLKTLDGLSISTTIHHRLIDISQEFLTMFSDNLDLSTFPKQYVSIYDIEISYDEVKRIEEIRKNSQQLLCVEMADIQDTSKKFIEKFYPNLL